MPKRPIAIDLFSGVGGLSLGLEQVGFDVEVAVEVDPIHACAHQYNFPQCNVIVRSIRDVDAETIRRKLSGNDVALVAGGAPCQGFSIIGKRALDDPRNSLVKEFLRVVGELRPRYFLFENVKGLTIGKHRNFLLEIYEAIAELGYSVLPWRVLNTKDFGVPQSRERLILLGARSDCPLPQYPAPLDEHVTCGDALGDLPDAELFPALLTGDSVPFDYLEPPTGYSALMRCSTGSAWRYGYRRVWNEGLLTSSIRTDHGAIARERFAATAPGKTEPVSRFFRLAEDGVANTLRAGTDSARGAHTSPRPIHYDYARCVTVREMARLSGFPDWFRLHQTKWHGARQIGNAVPPPLAYYLGREIMQAGGFESIQPVAPVQLGDERLLGMTAAIAAVYYGVVNPIAKRSRQRVAS